MTTNVLDPSALLSSIPKLLPPSSKTLKYPSDAIAALVHAVMSVLSFRLIAVDESSPPLPEDSSNVLPSDWNTNAPGNYTFRYKHNQSSLEYLIKITSLGRRTLVNAIALESDKVSTLEISTDDFTSPSFFPYDLESFDQPLVHGFISSNRVADFVSQYKLAILQKIMPGLRKEGYTEEDTSTNSTGSPSSSSQPPAARPRPQVPPMGPVFPQGVRPYPENPLEIGRRDLDPFPTNLFTPTPLFPPGSGDGMFVGPDHPIFGARRDRRDVFGGRGPWGGDGYLPPLGAPPGARFDPVGPGPFPGGLGPRRGGPPGGGNQTEPDNDEFMPPGAGDMFL
ncbi:PI31 proteasome regulator N-terminal domain containing protein [Amanita muscaria]